MCFVCSVVSDFLQRHGQAPLSMEFPREEYWSGSPFLTPVDLPNSATEFTPPASPALQARSLH